MGQLLVVANRLPFNIIRKAGYLHFSPSPGGLAVGLSSLPESSKRLWLGWPGVTNENLKVDEKDQIREQLAAEDCHPVFLSRRHMERYYQGFCNKTIWPLFHYFPRRSVYEARFWETYKQVNEAFCDEVMKITKPDDSIWVHDYQLMLPPQLLRQRLPDSKIGFFLHIPWPSFELFRLLPWREQILNGLLGADLIGFHTYDYVRHFLSSVSRIIGLEHMLGNISVANRVVKVDAFPMGIDYEKYSRAIDNPGVEKEANKIRSKIGERKIILSIDRLDYSKGIIERLEAFDLFLSENPQYRGAVTLIMVAVPTRTGVEDYRKLRSRLEQLVGRINGEYGTMGYTPVWYLYRSLPFAELTALYNVSDVALVTPLRDGMNLIAKEFIAAKADKPGVLVISEMAGAACELGEALVVNPCNKDAIVEAIKGALEMPPLEQLERNKVMQERLRRYSVSHWSHDFLGALSDIKNTQQQMSAKRLTDSMTEKLAEDCRKSNKRLFLLDYDGTLVGFKGKPAEAGPDDEIIDLLKCLSRDPKNTVVIISGRDKTTLEDWLGHIGTALVAEHGGWIKLENREWQSRVPLDMNWKDTIRPILELHTDRTPGSTVEEKDFSLVWHYRRADPEFAYVRGQELRAALVNLTENLDVGVFEGNKILEVKSQVVNKGRAAEYWVTGRDWDFILAAGDDYTDEEMFSILPDEAYSIKVGFAASKARFNVDSVKDIRMLLKRLSGDSDGTT
ncbi:MAG: bifunctional alpha,alpha-trehalose-phosphate synthase (UDP-forming)/trehalose-phosphatase [Planctomycetaceae bacterium]|nr:MAG: bifunctional alpha,alpha-trehalose-phosphate synthase (UDP-forming)/trehalose-phosphatase [Planctomycetaceae bacterium]